MDQVKQYALTKLKELETKLETVDVLVQIEKKTKVPVVYTVLGAAALALIIFYLFIGMDFICDIVTFVPPAYLSFKAIESKKADTMEYLLQYWVVFVTIQLIEMFGIALIIGQYYYFAKLGFLVYCFHPELKGAKNVYDIVIKPFMHKHEKDIADAIEGVQSNIKDIAAPLKDAVDAVADVTADFTKAAAVSAVPVPLAAGADTNERSDKDKEL